MSSHDLHIRLHAAIKEISDEIAGVRWEKSQGCVEVVQIAWNE